MILVAIPVVVVVAVTVTTTLLRQMVAIPAIRTTIMTQSPIGG